MRYFIILLAVAFMGCKSGIPSHGGHNHEAEGHDHAAEEAHGHEGHDHGADELHGHEPEATEAGHNEGGIVFTRGQAEAAGLTIETVELSTFHRVIKTSGQIQSLQGGEAVVVATSSGIVSFPGTFAEGSAVGQGETIATLSAQGLVDGDPAARAQIEYETAEREYRRAEELVKDRIISEREFNEAKRRYETACATVSAGSGKAVSPLTGYVKNLFVGAGEYVATGQPIATVTRTGRMQLRAEVPERWFGALSAITGANFKTAYGETVYHTDKLLSYGRAADGAYIPVLFEFANAGEVVPGAFAEVWLLGKPLDGVISVPKSALSEEQGLYFVYVHCGGDDYAKREVTPGAENGERVQILGGLTPGDRVVTRGTTQVRLAAMSGTIPEGHGHSH